MIKVDLNGKWNLVSNDGVYNLVADIPGSDVGNLIKQNLVKNPLISGKEEEGIEIAKKDYTFSRKFEVKKDVLEKEHVYLKCEKVDTLCDVYLNNKQVASLNNSYIPLNVDVKNELVEGENLVEFKFKSPYNYIVKRQQENALPNNFNGVNGIPYIRKPGCHFGWDWGPCVPYSGILDDIYLKAINTEITNIDIKQDTKKEMAVVAIKADGAKEITMESPKGEEIKGINGVFEVKNPELWYTKELSGKDRQPLYNVVIKNDEEEVVKYIGLRSCYLNQEKDEYGTNFCITLNGEKIFAKGANVIPFAAIYEDATKEDVDYYIDLALKSNFNILRIWGGASYAVEYLMSECDKKGILIWQDFCFACQLYPFYEKDLLDNVVEEIKYNVVRQSMHPSMALFCGNNEIETMYSWMPKTNKLMKAYEMFFYNVVPDAIKDITDVSYIPSSPLGTACFTNINSDGDGDMHMWNVWHGLKKLDYYQTRYSRFLSEFGLESLPSMKAISTFASGDELDITSASFNAHQKCIGGNEKMLFYLTEMFDFPKHFEDLPYLTGIVQAECIKNATVHFRQNKGRCNGAIYWQYNDVWNCPSWSSVDFEKVPKALQYKAKEFFAPVTVSCKKENGIAHIYAHNDTLKKVGLKVVVKEISIANSKVLNTYNYVCNLEANSFAKLADLKVKLDSYLEISFNNETLYEIFNKPLKLPLKKVNFNVEKVEGGVEISVDNFAFNIFVDSNEILEENYFSLSKGEKKFIKVKDADSIKLTCANNIEFKGENFKRKWFRLTYRLKIMNILNFIYYSRT